MDFLADSSEQQVREAFIEGFDFLSKQKQRTTFDYEEAIGQGARILLGTNGTEAFDRWRAGQKAFKTNPSGPVEELPDNRKLLGAVWNFVSAGIVVPRLKREGGHCVFLRLTLSEKGERVVSKADEHPLHPGFLERFRAAAPTATDPVVAHLEDAVTCLEAGVLRPALMMVGVANEMTVRITHDALAHQTKVTKAGPMAKMRDLLGDIDAVAGAWKGGGGSKDEQHRLKVAVGAAETVLGGEPTFPKSRLAVRRLGGMLLRGASKDDVLEDYRISSRRTSSSRPSTQGLTHGWGARVNVKLLLDENLSPKVAEILRAEDKLDAIHIRDRGLLEAKDHEVLDRAYTEDRVLATKNVGHFVKLARARELHPGIVLLEDGYLVRDEQLRVLRGWPSPPCNASKTS